MDGSVMGGIPATQVTELIKVEIGEHWEHLRFIVVDRMIEPLILGLTWLDKWQLVIWWEGGFRKLRFAIGRDLPPPDRTKTGQSTPIRPTAGSFPSIYKDLEEVCSEDRCEELPPHRATDCAIELIPGIKLPKPRMYSMTPKELSEMRAYINKNLARGFIQPSRSQMAAPVLFREKKDGGLRLCVDFRSLNAVKNIEKPEKVERLGRWQVCLIRRLGMKTWQIYFMILNQIKK